MAELLRGVASALDLVHAKGLIHRDVKPENLMYVVRADGSETVMLMDFGIATLVAPRPRGSPPKASYAARRRTSRPRPRAAKTPITAPTCMRSRPWRSS